MNNENDAKRISELMPEMEKAYQIYTAANWSVPDDNFTEMFLSQNHRQFWLPEEISLQGDLLPWSTMLSDDERTAYMRVLVGLTMLDTIQGDDGMAKIMQNVESHQRKAVLSFMGGMESSVHAKSYSNIFQTLATTEEIRSAFEWVYSNKYAQRKARIIRGYYDNITDDISLYKAMTTSVFLESFLFYSGFYYPFYMAGHGRLVNSGEIISLITRDEAIHGVYVGLLAQEIFNRQSPEVQSELEEFTYSLMMQLYDNEADYTADVYDSVGLTEDVMVFVRYNANKAIQNLGLTPQFEEETVNAVVMNGISTQTKSHDFFSQKGNGYKKAIVEAVHDEDFIFEPGVVYSSFEKVA